MPLGGTVSVDFVAVSEIAVRSGMVAQDHVAVALVAGSCCAPIFAAVIAMVALIVMRLPGLYFAAIVPMVITGSGC